MAWFYKGVHTKQLYQFAILPNGFQDAYGNVLPRIPSYNGEVLIQCLDYGGVQEGTAGPPIPLTGLPGWFAPGHIFSLWEKEPPS